MGGSGRVGTGIVDARDAGDRSPGWARGRGATLRHVRGVVLLWVGVIALHAWLLSAWHLPHAQPQPQPRASSPRPVTLRVVAPAAGWRAPDADTARAAIRPGALLPELPTLAGSFTDAAHSTPAMTRLAQAPDRPSPGSAATTPRAMVDVAPRRLADAPRRSDPPTMPDERPPGEAPEAGEAPAEPGTSRAADPGPGPSIDAPPLPEDPPPHYRTRPPPAAVLRYALRRGTRVGVAVLTWEPGAEGYRLTFEADTGSARWTQKSVGGFDADGLAPLRHTDMRTRRGTVATNFRRDEAVVSFSASSGRQALVAGTQDRLSWLVQLAAVLEAEPERREPGATILLPVAGSRGELEVWVLRNEGSEEVSPQSGPRPALRLSRQPVGLRDLVTEVWVDPARHHLPLRWSMRSPLGDTVLEFDLLEASLGP